MHQVLSKSVRYRSGEALFFVVYPKHSRYVDGLLMNASYFWLGAGLYGEGSRDTPLIVKSVVGLNKKKTFRVL